MNTLGGILAALAVLALLAALFRDSGYRSGFKDGYAQARKDVDNWWLRVGREMEEEERKIGEAEGR